jgi:hypothetical protein
MKIFVTVRNRKLLLLGSAGAMALWLSAAPARAQFFCAVGGGVIFSNGQCTTPGGIPPGGGPLPGTAFSTAALGSQALGEVSQTVTQQSTDTAFASVQRRREQETAAPAPAPQRTGAPARRAPRDLKSPQMMVVKTAPPPAYFGPTYAFWAHGFGDWEKRDIDTTGFNAGLPNATTLDRRMTTWGFLGGADVTLRQGGPGVWILGVLTGYMSADVKLSGQSLGNAANVTNLGTVSTVNATISGPSVGGYATYANGPFSADVTLKVDFLEIDQSYRESYIGNGSTAVSTGAVTVDLTNVTVGGNVNYRIPVSPMFWYEPTAGFRYTNSSVGSNAAIIGLDDGSVFRLQGGVRFGWENMWGPGRLLTTITGLVYSDVSVDGLVINTAGFVGSPVLPNDEGKVRGMGIFTLNYDNNAGIIWYGQADVRGGEDYFGVGGRLGVRVSLN